MLRLWATLKLPREVMHILEGLNRWVDHPLCYYCTTFPGVLQWLMDTPGQKRAPLVTIAPEQG